MTDPVYGVIITGVLVALATALLIAPPTDPVDEEGGVGAVLLGAACAAVIAMGVLALGGHPAESTICGAIAWLLVMPCVWLSRAPRPAGGWTADEDEDEDDDDGGSPRPRQPSDPPAPDDGLPGLRPPVTSPAARSAAWALPAPAAPVLPTAARAQLLLAARDAEQRRAELEVQRLLAATAAAAAAVAATKLQAEAATPPLAPLAAPLLASAQAPGPDAPPPTAPQHKPATPRLSPTPRPRGEHRAFASLLAAVRRGRLRARPARAPRKRRDHASPAGAARR